MKYFENLISAERANFLRRNSQKLKIALEIKKGIISSMKKGYASYTSKPYEDFYKPVFEAFVPELKELGYETRILSTKNDQVLLEVRW